jgi:hypothetical protein
MQPLLATRDRYDPIPRGLLISGLLLPGLLLVPAPARGQEAGPLVTDRPDQTESAEAVPTGALQLELGWTYGLDEEDGIELRTHAVPGALLRIGLGSGIEARIGFAGWISQDEEVTDPLLDPGFDHRGAGAGDAELGVKWEIAELESAGTRIALLGGVSLPVGEAGFGSERADPTFRLAISNELSDRVSLGYNVGMQWETVDATATAADAIETQSDLLYTVAFGFGLTERVGAFVEGFGFLGMGGDRPDRHSVDGGLTLLLSDTIQLDASAGLGLNAAAEDWFLGAGVSARFPR